MTTDAIRALVEFPVQAFLDSANRIKMNATLRKQQEIYRPGRAAANIDMEPVFKIIHVDDIKVEHESKTE